MKALIISFFCVILGYSVFFDNKEAEVRVPEKRFDVSSSEKDSDRMPFFISDSIEFLSSQKALLNADETVTYLF